jgi:PAS domain S-box-containing protein
LVGVGHFRIDVRSRTATWSDRVYRIFGLEPGVEPPRFETVLSMFGEADREMVRQMLVRAMAEGEPYTFEAPLTGADGVVRRVASTGVAERDSSGTVTTVFGVVMDATEARQREQALAESEARYRLLADRATDVIVRYDAKGVVEFVSPSVRQYGYRPEDLIGRKTRDFVHPEDAGMMSVRGLGEPQGPTPQNEFRLRRADGEWVWLEGNPAPIRDERGKVIGAVTVLRDVTQRRAMDQELRRKRAEAEAAAVAKAEFLANMSHEIRTPLTGIIGFASLLEGLEGMPGRARTYINRITTSGQALLSVVNDVLDFSKMEAGQIALDPQPFDPLAFVDESLELERPEARKKGLDLTLAADGDLPPAVLADRGRARQVLLNLLGNAIKFTVEGEVDVRVGYLPAEGRLRVEVSDTGVGIPPEQIDRLFQRFSQVDGSTTREHGGSGLGLAICKGLVEMMDGAIGVESEVGKGSHFWFTIAAPVANTTQSAQSESAPAARIHPMRLLVVDDVAMNRELVADMLAPFQVSLTEAAGGAEAVEAAMATAFDLILMDLQMPGMDGFAATRAIRANCELNQSTPIVALSANVLPEQIDACREAGMNDHIAKPIGHLDLLAKIGRWSPRAAHPSQAAGGG